MPMIWVQSLDNKKIEIEIGMGYEINKIMNEFYPFPLPAIWTHDCPLTPRSENSFLSVSKKSSICLLLMIILCGG